MHDTAYRTTWSCLLAICTAVEYRRTPRRDLLDVLDRAMVEYVPNRLTSAMLEPRVTSAQPD